MLEQKKKQKKLGSVFSNADRIQSGGRINLGGLRLATRQNIFLIFGLIAIIFSITSSYFLYQKFEKKALSWDRSHRISLLALGIDAKISAIKDQQRKILQNNNIEAIEKLKSNLNIIANELKVIRDYNVSEPAAPIIATLRDGLVQYDDALNELLALRSGLKFYDKAIDLAEIQRVMSLLRGKLYKLGFLLLYDQVSEIDLKAWDVLYLQSPEGIGEITKLYDQFRINFEKKSKIGSEQKKISDLVGLHEKALLGFLKDRLRLRETKQQFDDILTYMQPSIEKLRGFSRDFHISSKENYDELLERAGLIWLASALTIILIMLAMGLLFIRSMINGIRILANCSARLAAGESEAIILGTGNVDATGHIARALIKWSDDLGDMVQVRQDLLETRRKLANTLQESDRKASATVEAAKVAIIAEVAADNPISGGKSFLTNNLFGKENSESNKVVSNISQVKSPDSLGRNLSKLGPISLASKDVAQFSGFVASAAVDVERVETLIQALEEASIKISLLNEIISLVSKQAYLIERNEIENNNSDDKKSMQVSERDSGDGQNENIYHRNLESFNSMSQAASKAETTLQDLDKSLGRIRGLANQIASAASVHALDATKKLLSQSEHLQKMLDNIIKKIELTEVDQSEKASVENKNDLRGSF